MSKTALIQVDHVYQHSPKAVWRGLTDPELLARWWAPGDMRAVVGHQFDLDMGPWGKQPCEVLAVEEERLLRIRFATSTLDTTITFSLQPEGTGTRLTLTHEGFDLDSPMSRRAFEGMKPGWPGVLAKLNAALTS
jgi:uncharacterized protein YndB with AHSA1/START domain